MSIITISRGTYSRGSEIAEKVAEKLGYECVSREILLEASKDFHVPEIKLVSAIHDAPSILSRLGHQKEKYVAYIQSALLRHLKADNVVYQGLAGHFFVKDIPHVLKVRIIADMEERVKWEMERKNISEKAALENLKKDDEQRRRWSNYLYGIDTSDPSLYDLVIHVGKIGLEDAVELICQAVSCKNFQTTAESEKAMEDLALASEIRAFLVDNVKGDIRIKVDGGLVMVSTEAALVQEAEIASRIRELVESYSGVKEVRVEVKPMGPYGE